MGGMIGTIQAASVGIPDTLFIMVLALVVFGPRRLPAIGRQIGKLMYEFRKASNDFKFQMDEEMRSSEEADRRNKIEEENRRLYPALNASLPETVDGIVPGAELNGAGDPVSTEPSAFPEPSAFLEPSALTESSIFPESSVYVDPYVRSSDERSEGREEYVLPSSGSSLTAGSSRTDGSTLTSESVDSVETKIGSVPGLKSSPVGRPETSSDLGQGDASESGHEGGLRIAPPSTGDTVQADRPMRARLRAAELEATAELPTGAELPANQNTAEALPQTTPQTIASGIAHPAAHPLEPGEEQLGSGPVQHD